MDDLTVEGVLGWTLDAGRWHRPTCPLTHGGELNARQYIAAARRCDCEPGPTDGELFNWLIANGHAEDELPEGLPLRWIREHLKHVILQHAAGASR